MWIQKGDSVELTAKDKVFFDGIVHDIVVIKNEEQFEAAILLSQQYCCRSRNIQKQRILVMLLCRCRKLRRSML